MQKRGLQMVISLFVLSHSSARKPKEGAAQLPVGEHWHAWLARARSSGCFCWKAGYIGHGAHNYGLCTGEQGHMSVHAASCSASSPENCLKVTHRWPMRWLSGQRHLMPSFVGSIPRIHVGKGIPTGCPLTSVSALWHVCVRKHTCSCIYDE